MDMGHRWTLTVVGDRDLPENTESEAKNEKMRLRQKVMTPGNGKRPRRRVQQR